MVAKEAIDSQICTAVNLIEMTRAELDMSAGAYPGIKLQDGRRNNVLEDKIVRYYSPFQHPELRIRDEWYVTDQQGRIILVI